MFARPEMKKIPISAVHFPAPTQADINVINDRRDLSLGFQLSLVGVGVVGGVELGVGVMDGVGVMVGVFGSPTTVNVPVK